MASRWRWPPRRESGWEPTVLSLGNPDRPRGRSERLRSCERTRGGEAAAGSGWAGNTP